MKQDAKGWCKLADLQVHDRTKTLSIVPKYRSYLRQADAGYDWAVGKPFVVVNQDSPYYGYTVAVDEVNNLKREGYTHIHLHYNEGAHPMEFTL